MGLADRTGYADADARRGEVTAANLRMRPAAMPQPVRGLFLHPNVWSWEVPVYFWFGGMASGAAFAALAADLPETRRRPGSPGGSSSARCCPPPGC